MNMKTRSKANRINKKNKTHDITGRFSRRHFRERRNLDRIIPGRCIWKDDYENTDCQPEKTWDLLGKAPVGMPVKGYTGEAEVRRPKLESPNTMVCGLDTGLYKGKKDSWLGQGFCCCDKTS